MQWFTLETSELDSHLTPWATWPPESQLFLPSFTIPSLPWDPTQHLPKGPRAHWKVQRTYFMMLLSKAVSVLLSICAEPTQFQTHIWPGIGLRGQLAQEFKICYSLKSIRNCSSTPSGTLKVIRLLCCKKRPCLHVFHYNYESHGGSHLTYIFLKDGLGAKIFRETWKGWSNFWYTVFSILSTKWFRWMGGSEESVRKNVKRVNIHTLAIQEL